MVDERRMVDYGLLLLRVTLGVLLISHGFHKWFGLGLVPVMKFFEMHGFPGWMLFPVLIAEIGGGTCLVLGVYTRVIALLLLPTLIGASTVHFANGYFFSSPGGGWSFPVFLILIDAAVMLTGGGAYAFSAWRETLRAAPLGVRAGT